MNLIRLDLDDDFIFPLSEKMFTFSFNLNQLILPLGKFERLAQGLEIMVEPLNAIWLTEVMFSLNTVNLQFPFPPLFKLLISQKFSVLLLGNPKKEDAFKFSNSSDHSPSSCPLDFPIQVGLSFDPQEILTFLTQLESDSQSEFSSIQKAKTLLQPNDPKIQGEFTLKLLEICHQDPPIRLNQPREIGRTETGISSKISPDCQLNSLNLTESNSQPYLCQPLAEILAKQLEQERVLNEITRQICQGWEFPLILSTALTKIRTLLDVDRLIFYQFKELAIDLEECEEKEKNYPLSPSILGRVTYEALANPSVISLLNLTANLDPLIKFFQEEKSSEKRIIIADSDVRLRVGNSPELLELIKQYEIRSQLMVSLEVKEELWGVLIAHHQTRREWSESEQQFLSKIVEHLAIGIVQTNLYGELQKQKNILKKRVIERTQDLRDALESAESANRAKTEFLATMSHELRTPLTCILGISATLLRWGIGQSGQKSLSPEKQQYYLQSIHDSGEHLLSLINDLLDLSQIEAGKTFLKISEFSLRKLANSTLNTLWEKAIHKEVNLLLDFQINNSGERFRADRRRLKQILINLLSNAIKFTPPKGTVILRLWKETNVMFFQVEDTGIGIAEEQKSLLFKKFQQLDSPYRREYGGIGLGLALTKQLVELHGGNIEVDSTVNVGSIFTVKIPIQKLDQWGENESNDGEKNLKKMVQLEDDLLLNQLILIADDEEFAQFICDLLNRANYQVIWILESSTVVDQIDVLQPNGVIIDMRLPGKSAFDIIKKLRSKISTRFLKILALYTDLDPKINELEIDDYLSQPINPQLFLQKISHLLK